MALHPRHLECRCASGGTPNTSGSAGTEKIVAICSDQCRLTRPWFVRGHVYSRFAVAPALFGVLALAVAFHAYEALSAWTPSLFQSACSLGLWLRTPSPWPSLLSRGAHCLVLCPPEYFSVSCSCGSVLSRHAVQPSLARARRKRRAAEAEH